MLFRSPTRLTRHCLDMVDRFGSSFSVSPSAPVGLVACDSISCTDKELKAEKYVYDFLQSIPYFKEHPERCGLHKIPNDPFSRAVPYALILGKKRDTVILSGHIDVVETTDRKSVV